MNKISFYTNPMSRGQIARWALHEVGADYDQHLMDYATTLKGAAFLAINPMGKIPAIIHHSAGGDRIVTETAAICAYLAEAFPSAGLAPLESERADYYRWLFFAAGPIDGVVTATFLGLKPTPEQERMAGFGSADRVANTIEALLAARPYVCGERFTMADIYFGTQLGWGVEFGNLPERPNFREYIDRIRSRPAYGAAKAIDDAQMAMAKSSAEK